MMIEQGEVTKVVKDKVVISFDRKTECKKCGMCAFGKDDMKVKLTLKNKINAQVGDIVTVTMGEKFVLTSAFVVYLIPVALIGLFLGLGIYFNCADYVQIILAMSGLVVGFIFSFLIDKLIKNKKHFSPVIKEIVGHVDESETDEKELNENLIDENK